MLVRPAVDTDLPLIAEMQREHWEEKQDKPNALSFNSGFALKNLIEAYSSKDDLFLVAVTDSLEIAGYMWCGLIQPHYSHEFYATERYLYIKPEYRLGKAAKYLIEEAIMASRNAGAKHLQLGEMSGNVRLEKAYAKRYIKLGTVFQVNL